MKSVIDLSMEAASILRKITSSSGCSNVEFEIVEEGFKMPTLYCPPLESIPVIDSLSEYKHHYQWSLSLFDASSRISIVNAKKAVDAILANRLKVPLYNADGTICTFLSASKQNIQRNVKLTDIRASITDDGISNIFVEWDSLFEFTKETVPKIQRFHLSLRSKGGS